MSETPGLIERERLARFGGAMFKILFTSFCEGEFEIELNDLITRDAVACGLVEKVAFDPEEHSGENDDCCEPGDDWFVASEAGRKALITKYQPTIGRMDE